MRTDLQRVLVHGTGDAGIIQGAVGGGQGYTQSLPEGAHTDFREGMTYGEFMNGLKKSGVDINRKMLADMAVREPASFRSLVTLAGGKDQEK